MAPPPYMAPSPKGSLTVLAVDEFMLALAHERRLPFGDDDYMARRGSDPRALSRHLRAMNEALHDDPHDDN